MKTAVELQQLADICEERGDYIKASRLHGKALAAAQRDYGPESVELESFLYNSGMIALALDENTNASRHFERLLKLIETCNEKSELIEEIHQLIFALEKNTLVANA